MQADVGELLERTEANEAPPAQGPKVRLCTLASLDGRTRSSRRTRALIRSYLKDLGGKPSAADMQLIERAAALSAICEDATARSLAGEVVDLDQVVRISNAARRAVADLHLRRGV